MHQMQLDMAENAVNGKREQMKNQDIQDILAKISPQRLAELTRELIRRESEAPPGHEASVGHFIVSFFQQLGIPVRKQDCGNGRFNVIADILGRKPELKPYLYVGHIDVVPAGNPEAWTTPPYEPEERDGRIYGRGAADMKGSVACMLHMAEVFAACRHWPQRPLQMLFNVDEEHHNLGMKTFIASQPQAELAVIGEPTAAQIHLGHRGVMAFQADFQGRSAHAAQPQLGVNAIEQAMLLGSRVQQLNQKLGQKPDPYLGAGSIVTTMIRGGIKVNTVPEHCTAEMDRRLTVGETPELAEMEIRRLLEDIPEAKLQITTCCPTGWIPADHPQVQRLQEAYRTAGGAEAVISVFPACCEAGMLSEAAGIPAVIFGPGDIAQAHQTDEYVTIDSLYQAARTYAAFFA